MSDITTSATTSAHKAVKASASEVASNPIGEAHLLELLAKEHSLDVASVTKAIKAARAVALARTKRGSMLGKLPLIGEQDKASKVTKEQTVTDWKGANRDASSLSKEQVKELNGYATLIQAASKLGM